MNALNDMHDDYTERMEREAILDDIRRCHDQHTPACNLVSVITYRGGYREIIMEFVQSGNGNYCYIVIRDGKPHHVTMTARAIQSVDDTYIPGGVALLQAYTLWKSYNYQYRKLAGFRDTIVRHTWGEDDLGYEFDDEWVDACHTIEQVKALMIGAYQRMAHWHRVTLETLVPLDRERGCNHE